MPIGKVDALAPSKHGPNTYRMLSGPTGRQPAGSEYPPGMGKSCGEDSYRDFVNTPYMDFVSIPYRDFTYIPFRDFTHSL